MSIRTMPPRRVTLQGLLIPLPSRLVQGTRSSEWTAVARGMRGMLVSQAAPGAQPDGRMQIPVLKGTTPEVRRVDSITQQVRARPPQVSRAGRLVRPGRIPETLLQVRGRQGRMGVPKGMEKPPSPRAEPKARMRPETVRIRLPAARMVARREVPIQELTQAVSRALGSTTRQVRIRPVSAPRVGTLHRRALAAP